MKSRFSSKSVSPLTPRIKLNAADQRNLSLASYFLRSGPNQWNPKVPLASRPPYKVPFSQFSLKFLNEQVPFSQTLFALNGTLVGLVIDSTNYHQKHTPDFFGLVPTHAPLIHDCVGLGLVRAIDVKKKYFYIVTPVDGNILKKVNMLVRGPLECPISLIAQRHGRSRVPYTSLGTAEGIGALENKTRHLGRRKIVK